MDTSTARRLAAVLAATVALGACGGPPPPSSGTVVSMDHDPALKIQVGTTQVGDVAVPNYVSIPDTWSVKYRVADGNVHEADVSIEVYASCRVGAHVDIYDGCLR